MTDKIRTARRLLRRERRRRVDERAAFRAFVERVEEMPSAPTAGRGRGRETGSGPGAGEADAFARVRAAYAATVRSVPHADERRREPFADRLRAELGEGVATALADAETLPRRLRSALVNAAGDARKRRAERIEALDAEAAALDDAETRFASIRDALEAATDGDGGASPGVLDTLDARLDALAADRRATVDSDDAPSTAYREAAFDDPVLATVGDLRGLIGDARPAERPPAAD